MTLYAIWLALLLIIRKLLNDNYRVKATLTYLLRISLIVLVFPCWIIVAVSILSVPSLTSLPPEAQAPGRVYSKITVDGNFFSNRGIDPLILVSIADIESSFNNDALGAAGEVSMFQLMPQIIKWCNIPSHPTQEEAIICASKLIIEDIQPNIFNKELKYTIAAYNAGWPKINSCRCIPNEGYVEKFFASYNFYKGVHVRYLGNSISGWHGSVDGWWGIDYQAGCNKPIYSPISGTVITNGTDGYIGPYSNGRQNTLLVIQNKDIKVALLHGEYTPKVGDFLIVGQPIGFDSNIGNVINNVCHTHFVKWVEGKNIQ